MSILKITVLLDWLKPEDEEELATIAERVVDTVKERLKEGKLEGEYGKDNMIIRTSDSRMVAHWRVDK